MITVELNKLCYIDRLYAAAFVRAKKILNGAEAEVG